MFCFSPAHSPFRLERRTSTSTHLNTSQKTIELKTKTKNSTHTAHDYVNEPEMCAGRRQQCNGQGSGNVARREMIFQSAKETGLWSSHFHPRFPPSFPTLRSVFACVAVRSVYGLLIFLLPRASPRSPLACHEQPFLPLFRDIFPPTEIFHSRVLVIARQKAQISEGRRENTGSHTCVYVFQCYFLRYVFRCCCCCFMYFGMLHRCSYEFMKKIPFGFMYV